MSETPESIRSLDPLVEAALRPLSDNAELQLAAAGFLQDLKTSKVGVEAAISRWNEVDGRKRRSIWRMVLWVLLVLTSAVVWLGDSGELSRYFRWGQWLGSPFSSRMPDPAERISRRLNESQKLLLFGDLSKELPSERKEALWRSEPGNPAYFADYVAAFVSDNQKLPPDFLEVAKRIDPDNAWFTCLAASFESSGAVEKKSRRAKRVSGKTVYLEAPSWTIKDLEALERSLELLRQERKQQTFESYNSAMILKRLPLLPRESLLDTYDSVGILAGRPSAGLSLKKIGDVLAAKAWMLGDKGDVVEFRELSADAGDLLRKWSSGEVATLVDGLILSAVSATIADSFAPVAGKLGLEDEAARWKAISERFDERRNAKSSRPFIVDGKVVDPRTLTGALGGDISILAKQVENPPALTGNDLKPGRMVEHEILSRFSGYAVWLAMALGLGLVGAYRLRVSAMVRRLAARVEDLLRPVDWGWILGGGVFFPFGYVMVINRLTPLGGRDFGLNGVSWLLPAGQFLGLLVMWLIMPLVIVRWRLATRARCLGFSNPSWVNGLIVLAATAFVPIFGWVAISGLSIGWSPPMFRERGFTTIAADWASAPLWCSVALLALPLLWLIAISFRAVFGRARNLLHPVTTSRVLMRGYAFAMIVMILATVGFKSAEHSWFKQETLMRTDASIPGVTRYEYLIAVQIRKKVREILESAP